MKLALVGPSWPFRGGIAQTTTLLAQALSLRHSLATFLVPYRQYPRWIYPGEGDRDETALVKLPQAVACFSVFSPKSWTHLGRQLGKASADALVVPFWTVAWTPLLVYLTRQGLPVVAVVHNPHDHDGSPWNRWLSWFTLKQMQGFLAHARSVAWQLQRWFPQKPVQVHPLPPPPVNPRRQQEARAQLGLPENAVIFLFFGLVRAYKGLEVLLEALQLLPKDVPWLLSVAGELWEGEPRVRALMESPELRTRVVLHPRWIPEERVGAWFSAADVVVLPYRRATGSAVAAQALAYGLPIVASRTGGFVDVVEEGVNGLLVPPGDKRALAQALTQVLDARLRERLAQGAQRWAVRWSWASYAQSLEELVARVLPAALKA